MVITVPATGPYRNGPRPINMGTDIPQLLTLLEMVFGEKLDQENRQLLKDSAGSSMTPAFLWRLNPMTTKLARGYVWEENGRIVGNATLLGSKVPGRFLVVNVAVHPDYRRRGIARTLMGHLHEMAHRYHGREVLLQVVKENTAAVDLYRSMGYHSLGSMTTWQSSVTRVRELPVGMDTPVHPTIRELKSSEWQAAYALDVASLHPDLNWPEPPPPDVYKSGLWRQMSGFLNGRTTENWVISNSRNQLVGLASLWSEWGRMHQATVRIHPAWRGQLERPLLAKLTRRLKYLSRRNVQIHHPDTDIVMENLLREANFYPRRTLTHMRLDLK